MKDEYKLDEFLDMKRRWEAFRFTHGRKPKYIRTKDGEEIPQCIFDDMILRYENFVKKYNRRPRVVSILSDKWIRTGFWKQDKQDTGYTCGPSSLQMALSALGCTVKEDILKKAAGTTKQGTSHEGMLRAIQYAAGKCKAQLNGRFIYFKSFGWAGLISGIKRGCEYVIHLKPLPSLKTDYRGRDVWKSFQGGHYVYLVGVNPTDKLVAIADPTKGLQVFTVKQMENAMSGVSKESILEICKKYRRYG